MTQQAGLQGGVVVASHGRHYWVESDDGQRVLCHPRGKRATAVVGDRVQWRASRDEGTIEAVEPRRNLFYRQDALRTKAFAANLDQILVVLAAEPEYAETQLARALIAAAAQGITPLIAVNKLDLPQAFARSWERLQAYRDMDYPVFRLALAPKPQPGTCTTEMADDFGTLRARLQGRVTLVLGPSGVGKSTLINRLVPEARVATNAISTALNSGKHTTTSTTLYWLDAQRQTALIDSPGFQEFGLHHIAPTALAGWMPDLAHHLGECRFYNCSHLHEPGCKVIAALEDASSPSPPHPIRRSRYRIYQELFAELSA